MTIKTAWNLSPLFSGLDDPKLAEVAKASTMTVEAFARKWQDRDDWLVNPTILKEVLDEYERLMHDQGHNSLAMYYLWLSSELNQGDTQIRAKLNQARHLAQNLTNKTQFFGLRLARVSTKIQTEFLQHPELKNYHHFLANVFATAPYLLSEAEEKILNLNSGVAYGNWIQMTESSLSKEEREIAGQKRGFAEITGLISSQDKKIHQEAVKAFDEFLAKKIDMAEAEINSVLEYKKIDDELRGTTRPDQLRHLEDDLETITVDTMLALVTDHFQLAHDFYQLKAKLLGQTKLAYHERTIPYGQIGRHYEFTEAVAIVEKTLLAVSPKLAEKFKNLLTNGQVDALPKTGKNGGAFCAHDLLSAPTYVFLNHTGEFKDVLTLAHEMGHALNNELMREKLNALDFGGPISTAEVASTLVELLVAEELEAGVDEETKLALLVSRLDDDIATIFRQVSAYHFEQSLHEDFRQTGFLSAQNIGQLFKQKMTDYLGPAVSFETQHEKWWIYWSHFRRYFYVYSYASGLLIAKALRNKLREDKNFIDKIIEILSAGSSLAPKDIFAHAGLDIGQPDFWQKGLAETSRDLATAVALAKKLGKI